MVGINSDEIAGLSTKIPQIYLCLYRMPEYIV